MRQIGHEMRRAGVRREGARVLLEGVAIRRGADTVCLEGGVKPLEAIGGLVELPRIDRDVVAANSVRDTNWREVARMPPEGARPSRLGPRVARELALKPRELGATSLEVDGEPFKADTVSLEVQRIASVRIANPLVATALSRLRRNWHEDRLSVWLTGRWSGNAPVLRASTMNRTVPDRRA